MAPTKTKPKTTKSATKKTSKPIAKKIEIEAEEEVVKPNKKEKEEVIVKKDYRNAYTIGFVILFAFLIVISNLGTAEKEQTSSKDIEDYTISATVEDYVSMTDDVDNHVFLFARPTCSYCVKFEPIIIQVIKDYDLEVYYVNTDEEDETGIKAIQDSSPDLEDFGTPSMAITKDGTVTNVNVGYLSEAGLISFLKESGIIAAEE